jgi:hypothetical protein
MYPQMGGGGGGDVPEEWIFMFSTVVSMKTIVVPRLSMMLE